MSCIRGVEKKTGQHERIASAIPGNFFDNVPMGPRGHGRLIRKNRPQLVYHLHFEEFMSRDLDNLKRLCKKMHLRYGPDDEMVLQVKKTLESRQAIEFRHPWWFAPISERRSGGGSERNRGTTMPG